jgi:hypothetical protein
MPSYVLALGDGRSRRRAGEVSPISPDTLVRLIDVVNELAHLLYHVEDPQFFREFLEPLRDGWEKTRGVRDGGLSAC